MSSGSNNNSSSLTTPEETNSDDDGGGGDDEAEDEDDVIQQTTSLQSSQKSSQIARPTNLFVATPSTKNNPKEVSDRIQIPLSYKPLPNKEVMDEIMKSLGFQSYGLGETTRLGTLHSGKKRSHSEIVSLPIESFGTVLMDVSALFLISRQ